MTTELKPGTPEYDEAYQKEMTRLEAEAGKKSKADDKADLNTSEVKAQAKADDGKSDEGTTETADEIKARLDKAERDLQAAQKAIRDTQRWGHKNAEEVARLKREAEDRKRTETAPEILKANPGLEDAIKHVAGPREVAKPAPQEMWLQSVAKAIPDVETLLADQAFFAKAREKQVELGPDWDDPFIAIRELSELKVAHQSEKRAQAAVEAARKDFEVKSKKRNAMEMPGGSGGKDAGSGADEVTKWQTMSSADFAKARSKVMGY